MLPYTSFVNAELSFSAFTRAVTPSLPISLRNTLRDEGQRKPHTIPDNHTALRTPNTYSSVCRVVLTRSIAPSAATPSSPMLLRPTLSVQPLAPALTPEKGTPRNPTGTRHVLQRRQCGVDLECLP